MRFSFCLLLGLLSCGPLCCAGTLPRFDPSTTAEPFLKLRLAYASTPDFGGTWTVEPERTKLVEEYESDPHKFSSDAEHWLQICPVDAKVHLMLATLLMKTGDLRGNLSHRLMFYGLAASIANSGDGQSTKTAYKVISVDEEYTLLNYIGAKLIQQGLQSPYDVMHVELNGKAATIYFDASIPLAAEEREIKRSQHQPAKETSGGSDKH